MVCGARLSRVVVLFWGVVGIVEGRLLCKTRSGGGRSSKGWEQASCDTDLWQAQSNPTDHAKSHPEFCPEICAGFDAGFHAGFYAVLCPEICAGFDAGFDAGFYAGFYAGFHRGCHAPDEPGANLGSDLDPCLGYDAFRVPFTHDAWRTTTFERCRSNLRGRNRGKKSQRSVNRAGFDANEMFAARTELLADGYADLEANVVGPGPLRKKFWELVEFAKLGNGVKHDAQTQEGRATKEAICLSQSLWLEWVFHHKLVPEKDLANGEAVKGALKPLREKIVEPAKALAHAKEGEKAEGAFRIQYNALRAAVQHIPTDIERNEVKKALKFAPCELVCER